MSVRSVAVSPRRAIDVLGVTVGCAVVVWTGVLARRGVSRTEARIFSSTNNLPDGAFRAIWLPMQFGSFWAVPTVAGLALVRRRPWLAVALGAGGTTAWLAAKAVKPAVGRGRPPGLLPGVHRRGHEGGDLGFPSGHAAVSAAIATVAWPSASRSTCAWSAALGAFVPFARMYVGVHLPFDVIGGSALGLAVGSAVNLARAAPRPG